MKIGAKRKIVTGLLIWIPTLFLGLIASYLCQRHFGLALWQTNFVTFALGGAAYYGITSPLVESYMAWSTKREWRDHQDNDN